MIKRRTQLDRGDDDHRKSRTPGESVLFRLARSCVALCLLASTLVACQRPEVTITRDVPGSTPGRISSSTPDLAGGIVSTETPLPTTAAAPATTAVPSVTAGTPSPAPVVPVTATTPAVTATTVTNDDRAKELPAEINQLIAAVPAHIGMVIARPDGTTLYQTEGQTLFESASLYKLAIMVEVYRERDAGQLSFDDELTLYPGFFYEDDSVYGYDEDVYDRVPIGTLLTNMITLSSNVAAFALLYLVGTAQVNATAAELGMTSTKILWSPSAYAGDSQDSVISTSGILVQLVSRTSRPSAGPWPLAAALEGAYNVTTPADMALLFEHLVDGTVISQATSAEILDLLSRQEINDRLPAALPAGTKVAHKTGDLDNSVHDAGVIYTPAGPIVVVIMSDQVQDRQAVVDMMGAVALLAYDLPAP